MNNKSVWVGIGINFDAQDSVFIELINLSKDIAKRYGSNLILNSSTNQPHLNLYDLDVPEKNIEQIERVLSTIAQSSDSFTVTVNAVRYFEHGTIYLACDLNVKLTTLEKSIVEKVVQYKGNCKTEEYWQPWRKYSKDQLSNRSSFGNPHVLNTFVPHITVGFVKPETSKLEEIANTFNRNLPVKQIHINHMDLVIQNKETNQRTSKKFLFSL